MSLASFIQRRRYELDITQEDLEERTGLRQSYLSQLERGAIRNPRGRNLEALARGLEVSVDDLKVAMGYVVIEGRASLTSQSQMASASAEVVTRRDRIVRFFTENADELSDEDLADLEAVIERRRQARDGG